MPKAWVISVTMLDAARFAQAEREGRAFQAKRVIGLLSARNDVDRAEAHLRELCLVLRFGMDTQLLAARYVNPENPVEIHQASGSSCFWHNAPFLFHAERSSIVRTWEVERVHWLAWKPDRYERWRQDPETFRLVGPEIVDPPPTEAPHIGIALNEFF
jgi:hypothetical protein